MSLSHEDAGVVLMEPRMRVAAGLLLPISKEFLVMKRSRFGVSPAWLVVVSVASALPATRADTTLRWKFETGQKRSYVLTQKTVIKTELAGNNYETSSTYTTDMSWEVKSVDKDGTADMVQTIRRIRLQSRATEPSVDFQVDTAKAADEPGTPEKLSKEWSKVLRSMVGNQFKVKMTARGAFRDIKLSATVGEAIKDAGPAAAPLGDEEWLKTFYSKAIVPFPEAAIAQGKSWTELRRGPMPFGTMVMDNVYRLEGATGSVENIGVDAKLTIEPKKDAPFEMKVNAQQMKGHYHFNNLAGVLRLSDVVQKLSMTFTVDSRPVPTEFESTVKMELKNDTDVNSGKGE